MALSISGMKFWGAPARQLYVFPSGDVIHVLSSSDESVEEKHRAMVRKEDPKANGKGNAKAAEHSSTPPNAVKHNLLEKVDGVVGTIAEAKESLQISANFVQRQHTAEGLLHVANDTLKCAICHVTPILPLVASTWHRQIISLIGFKLRLCRSQIPSLLVTQTSQLVSRSISNFVSYRSFFYDK